MTKVLSTETAKSVKVDIDPRLIKEYAHKTVDKMTENGEKKLKEVAGEFFSALMGKFVSTLKFFHCPQYLYARFDTSEKITAQCQSYADACAKGTCNVANTVLHKSLDKSEETSRSLYELLSEWFKG